MLYQLLACHRMYAAASCIFLPMARTEAAAGPVETCTAKGVHTFGRDISVS